jgi:16S rRNA processing protein RimM
VELVVGRIGRAHGVRGEVTIDVRTDDPTARFVEGGSFATPKGELVIEQVRWHSGRLLLRFEGMRDRDDAEALRGTMLVVDSADIPPTGDPDEFHDHELIGLAVVTVSGEEVGVVHEIQHSAQDLLVVKRQGAEDAMIPFVTALVPEVDVDKGRVVIDPPPGLLD